MPLVYLLARFCEEHTIRSPISCAAQSSILCVLCLLVLLNCVQVLWRSCTDGPCSCACSTASARAASSQAMSWSALCRTRRRSRISDCSHSSIHHSRSWWRISGWPCGKGWTAVQWSMGRRSKEGMGVVVFAVKICYRLRLLS